MPIKIRAGFFFLIETEKLNLQFIQKCKEPKIAELILKQKNKVRELTQLYISTSEKLLHLTQNGIGTRIDKLPSETESRVQKQNKYIKSRGL